MTTVATDGTSISADGRMTVGDIIIADDDWKLEKMPDGSVIGGAGNADEWREATRLLRESDNPDRPLSGSSWSILRLYPSGAIALYAGNLNPTFLDAPQAIGSGRELALGALLSGRSPKQAVKIAATRDVWSGGTIRTLKPSRP